MIYADRPLVIFTRTCPQGNSVAAGRIYWGRSAHAGKTKPNGLATVRSPANESCPYVNRLSMPNVGAVPCDCPERTYFSTINLPVDPKTPAGEPPVAHILFVDKIHQMCHGQLVYPCLPRPRAPIKGAPTLSTSSTAARMAISRCTVFIETGYALSLRT